MAASDIMFVIKWWLVLFGIGIVFLPLTTVIFKNFFDKGYIFARILGMAFISYVVFVLGVLKILPFSELTIFLVIFAFLILNFLIFKYKYLQKNTSEESLRNTSDGGPAQRGLLRGGQWKIFLFEEFLFLTALFFWSYIRAHQPDIHGLEKYEDFGFLNSIIRSEYFPPRDMWLTPFSINYYYFGHLVTAILTKLSGIPSFITFNLMLATIFALTFTGVFSIAANLLFNLKSQISNLKIVFTGLLSGLLATMAGNLHTIYTFFKPYANESPVPFWQLLFSPQTFPNSYWYPNATRFIHNTIHEYPLYSFVVSDLHAHVLDMPFVLFTIAILFSIITNVKFQIPNVKSIIGNWKLEIGNLILITFMLAVMYMTNAWDGIIYLILTIFVLFYLNLTITSLRNSQPKVQNAKFKVQNYSLKLKVFNFELWFYVLRFTLYVSLVAIGFFLFSLPFSINFKPFASGIGVLCAPEFLTNVAKIGPFLFEKDHCLRSPIWQLIILYGFFYFWVMSFVFSLFRIVILRARPEGSRSARDSSHSQVRLGFAQNDIKKSDIFVLILILLSTFLIIIPEFIYIKDIYPGHYRANTMFKLVYQSFIMLSIASGYIIVKLISNFKFQISNFKLVLFVFIGSIGLLVVFLYPYFAINSYYNLKTYQGLDGIKYLKPLYPTDYEGILWINKNIKGQPVILEAQGDSYTDYARISANTGLPTVLGWTVHEWLWRGSYDVPSPRIPEVQTLYEAESLDETKKLIEKYKIELVFIGNLEREKYPKLNEEKFKTLGKAIYQNGQTKLYKISN